MFSERSAERKPNAIAVKPSLPPRVGGPTVAIVGRAASACSQQAFRQTKPDYREPFTP